MGYTKKYLSGTYLKWYNTISSYANVKPELNSYSSSISKISSLDWQGEGKEAVSSIVKDIDNSCQKISAEIANNIQKVQKCINAYTNICQLKDKYEEYNKLVDAYNNKIAELNRNKQNTEEVS